VGPRLARTACCWVQGPGVQGGREGGGCKGGREGGICFIGTSLHTHLEAANRWAAPDHWPRLRVAGYRGQGAGVQGARGESASSAPACLATWRRQTGGGPLDCAAKPAGSAHGLGLDQASAPRAAQQLSVPAPARRRPLRAAPAREGRAPIDPKELIAAEALPEVDPNQVLIITTGSQVGARRKRGAADKCVRAQRELPSAAAAAAASAAAAAPGRRCAPC
jgi:hypothetical protein